MASPHEKAGLALLLPPRAQNWSGWALPILGMNVGHAVGLGSVLDTVPSISPTISVDYVLYLGQITRIYSRDKVCGRNKLEIGDWRLYS